MITLRNLTLRRGSTILLKEINWTIYVKQRIGIVGANGSGKTSLFALLLQELEADIGEIAMPRQIKLAHVMQETPGLNQSALDFVLDGDVELRALEKDLQSAEELNDGTRIAHLHEKLRLIDAYTAPARAAQLLTGLGFKQNEQLKKVAEFSGGWRVRLNLANALMSRSDMLLLDEPTNHLDMDAVLWLEQWLIKYQGTLLLISHDRDFLDRTVDHIAYISQQNLKVYTGNYSNFEKLRAQDLLMQQAMYEKQQHQLKHMQSFVDRFRAKASKACQAQSRLKAIERMNLVCAVQTQSVFNFQFKKSSECPNPLLANENITIGYDQHIVLNKINFSIAPKARLAILGPNGAGKSSFIKMLAGELAPLQGQRTPSAGLRIGYFAQHQVDHLQLKETPLFHLQQLAAHATEVELRKFLGSFGFSGDRVLEPIQHFSGGEKSRLALALIVWQKPNLLLLDEPTNHLDLEMRNALSIALQEYDGAMILVSHDRFLIRSTVDELLLIANGKLEKFNGDLDEYYQWLMDFRKQQDGLIEPKSDISKKEVYQRQVKNKQKLRSLLTKIQKLENELTQLEKEALSIEMLLADNALYTPEQKQQLQNYLQTQLTIKQQKEKKEDEWLVACDERDQIISQSESFLDKFNS